MTFSIIIPTYDRNHDLESCLKSIRENSSCNHEIIVLYNMNDETKIICDRYGAVSVFDEARKDGKRVKSLWGILNVGIRGARNACVMYLNDDCLVMPGWDKIAERYFSENEKIGLLVLKTKGIGGVHIFRVIEEPAYGIPCANYAILNKKSGILFDESFSWYYGDGDLPLQFAAFSDYKIVCTDEDMIIHNHRLDANRIEHDSDFFQIRKDSWHYYMKWAGYRKDGFYLHKKSPFFCLCSRICYAIRIVFWDPVKYMWNQRALFYSLYGKNFLFQLIVFPVRIARRVIRFIRSGRKLTKDRQAYIRQCGKNELFAYHRKNRYIIRYDYLENAGSMDPHYFLQDIFVAKQVFSEGIQHIFDIGSRLDGYISHLLSMGVHVTMIDIRPLSIMVEGLDFTIENAMSLDSIKDNSIPHISCLHALEHFGLGRYGDSVDYDGWEKALHAMMKKLQTGGILFLSVPVSTEDVLMFNAHRIFRPVTIYKVVKESLSLRSFSVIRDYTVTTADFTSVSDTENCLNDITGRLGKFDCGIFVFEKKR